MKTLRVISIILITSLLYISLSAQDNKILKDEIQQAKNSFKRMMNAAHPRPQAKPKLSLIPLSSEQPNQIFLNVSLIANEDTENYKMQNESSIAVNPKNPKNLIASAVDYRGNSSTWIYVSSDGGKTWTNQNLGKPFPDWLSTNDPSVAFDLDGVGYFVYGGFGDMNETTPLLDGENAVFIAKSTDEGVTWKAHNPIIIHQGEQTLDSTFEDKYYITVDNSQTSPYFNHLYVPWKRMSPRDSATQIVISKSTDKGDSWSVPVNVSHRLSGSTEDTTFGQSFPLSVTGPNGEVYVVWNHGIEHGIGFAKSLDGGASFTEPRIIHKYNIFGTTTFIESEGWRHTVKGKVRAEAYPSAAVDIYNPDRLGYIYLCWAADKIPNIYFSRSIDQGETWSKPIIVHSDTTNDQFWPWLAIDPKNGDLSIMYLDSRDDPANLLCLCYVSYSSDGGLTWTDRRVSDISSDLRLNPFSNNAFAGDYNGCAFYDGIIYPSWVDMRNAKQNLFDSEAYTAYINVNAPMPVENFQSKIFAEKPEELELTWEAPTQRSFGQPLNKVEFNYVLYRNSIFYKEISSSETKFVDIGLTPYDLYEYHIYVASGKDTSLMKSTKGYPGGARNPAPPFIISAKGADNNDIKLDILLPTLREDSVTALVNLNKVYLVRDSSTNIEYIVQKSDTGNVKTFNDNPGIIGYYDYYSYVQDNSGSPNNSVNSNSINVFTGQLNLPYTESFENSILPNYKISGDWGLSANFYKTPPYSLTDSPSGKYVNKTSSTLQLFPIFKTQNNVRLSFWHAAIVHTSDTAFVEVSKDMCKTWTPVAKYNKSNYEQWQDTELNESDWKYETFDFNLNNSDTLFIRFRLETDYYRNEDGWYIDDIQLITLSNIEEKETKNSKDLSLYPNPAKDFITIISSNPFSENSEIILTDILGKSIDISKMVNSYNESSFTIDIRNLPVGAYFIRVVSSNFGINSKLFFKGE